MGESRGTLLRCDIESMYMTRSIWSAQLWACEAGGLVVGEDVDTGEGAGAAGAGAGRGSERRRRR